ncbi:MAG: hypothetical protein WCB27_14925 [Thermoguttaceae bacterium]
MQILDFFDLSLQGHCRQVPSPSSQRGAENVASGDYNDATIRSAGPRQARIALPQLFPPELRRDFKPPTPTLPRPCGDIFRACKEGGHPAFSNFADFSGPFVEGLLAGHLALHAGLHQRVEWDGEKMLSPTHPELSRWVKQERRKDWEL